MEYVLRNKEKKLLTFTVTPEGAATDLRWEEKAVIPVGISHYGGIKEWLLSRLAPDGRANAALLFQAGGIRSFQDALNKTYFLSLWDTYWVAPATCRTLYREISPYRGNFSAAAAQLALWGETSVQREDSALSPEYTTGGTRPKCWEKSPTGRLQLVQRSSPQNREVFSDYYAQQLLRVLGVDRFAHYELEVRQGEICSLSRIFTDELLGFLSAEVLGLGNDLEKLEAHYRKYHQFRFLRKMLLFDSLVCNPNRTPDKFGYQAVNGNNGVIWGAPLFGHGDSLLSKAPEFAFASRQAMLDYADSLRPAFEGDFVSLAKGYVSQRDEELLEYIANHFSFQPHPQHNLPTPWLDLLSQLVRTQAKRILGR